MSSVHTHLYFAEKEGERARQHSVLMHIPFDLPRILGNARPTHLLPALSLSLLRSNVRVLLSQEKGGRQNGGREIKKIEFASSLNQAERTSLDNSKFTPWHIPTIVASLPSTVLSSSSSSCIFEPLQHRKRKQDNARVVFVSVSILFQGSVCLRSPEVRVRAVGRFWTKKADYPEFYCPRDSRGETFLLP